MDAPVGQLADAMQPLMDRLSSSLKFPMSDPVAQALGAAMLLPGAGTSLPVYTVNRYSTDDSNGSWGFGSPSKDSICMIVDKPIIVWGLTAYGGRSGNTYTLTVEIHESDGSSDSDWSGTPLVRGGVEYDGAGHAAPRPAYFERGILLKAGVKYSLVQKTRSSGNGWKGKNGQSETSEKGVQFKWSSTNGSNNGTDRSSGQIPGVIFSKPTDAPCPPRDVEWPGYKASMQVKLTEAPSNAQVPVLEGITRTGKAVGTELSSPPPIGLDNATPAAGGDDVPVTVGIHSTAFSVAPLAVDTASFPTGSGKSGHGGVTSDGKTLVVAAPDGSSVVALPLSSLSSPSKDKKKSAEEAGGGAAASGKPDPLKVLLDSQAKSAAAEIEAAGLSLTDSSSAEPSGPSTIQLPSGVVAAGIALVGDTLVVRALAAPGARSTTLHLLPLNGSATPGSLTIPTPSGANALPTGLGFNGTFLFVPVHASASEVRFALVHGSSALLSAGGSAADSPVAGFATISTPELHINDAQRSLAFACAGDGVLLVGSTSARYTMPGRGGQDGPSKTGYALAQATLRAVQDAGVASKQVKLEGAAALTGVVKDPISALTLDFPSNLVLSVEGAAVKARANHALSPSSVKLSLIQALASSGAAQGTASGAALGILSRMADKASLLAPQPDAVPLSGHLAGPSAAIAAIAVLSAPLAISLEPATLGILGDMAANSHSAGKFAVTAQSLRLLHAHLQQIVAGSGAERATRISTLCVDAESGKAVAWVQNARDALRAIAGGAGPAPLRSLASAVLASANDVFCVSPEDRAAALCVALQGKLDASAGGAVEYAHEVQLQKLMSSVADNTALTTMAVGSGLLPPMSDPKSLAWSPAVASLPWTGPSPDSASSSPNSLFSLLLAVAAQQADRVVTGQMASDSFHAAKVVAALFRVVVMHASALSRAAEDASGFQAQAMLDASKASLARVLVPAAEAGSMMCGTVSCSSSSLTGLGVKAIIDYIQPLVGSVNTVLTALGSSNPEAIAGMPGLTAAVVGLHGALQELVALEPEERRSVEVEVRDEVTAVVSLASKHPYENSTDLWKEIHVPGASKMTVVFDTRTHTETGYDWVQIHESQSSSSQQFGSKYSGRSWPGSGLPALEIPGERAWLHFVTDGSGTEWGWELTATGHIPKFHTEKAPSRTVAMANATANSIGWLIQALVGGSTGGAVPEVISKAISNPLVAGGVGADTRPASAASQRPEDIDAFLAALVENSDEQGAAAMNAFMRKKTPGARGKLAELNKAVRTVIAAALRHAHLGGEARKLAAALAAKAAGTSSGPVKASFALRKVWSDAQKVRTWITREGAARVSHEALLAAAAAHPALDTESKEGEGGLESKESKDAEDFGNDPEAATARLEAMLETEAKGELAVLAAAESVRQRAALLLTTRVVTPSTAAKRWAQLGTSMKRLAAAAGAASPEAEGESDAFDAVVTQATAAAELRTMLSFQKAIGDAVHSKRQDAKSGSRGAVTSSHAAVSAQVNRFVCQVASAEALMADRLEAGQDALTECVRRALDSRSTAAQARADGFRLASSLLGGCTSPQAAANVFKWLLRGLRRGKAPSQDQADSDLAAASTSVHMLTNLEGASPAAVAQVLAACKEVLQHAIRIASDASAHTASKQVALLVLAQDYNVGDISMLQDIALLPLLRRLLATGSAPPAPAAAGAGASESKGGEEVLVGAEDDLSSDATAIQELCSPRMMADAILRVLLARLVGLEGQQTAIAVATAASTPARMSTNMQRSLVHIAREALLGAADARSLQLLGMEGLAGEGDDVELVPTAPMPPVASPGTLTFLGGDTAVPVFLEGAPRVAPGAVVSDTYTMSMWVYAPTVPMPKRSRGDAVLETAAPLTSGLMRAVAWDAGAATGVLTTTPAKPRVATSASREGCVHTNAGLASGSLTWQVKVKSEGRQTVSLGVAEATMGSAKLLNRSCKVWAVRGFDGKLVASGQAQSRGDESARKMPEACTREFTLTLPEGGAGGTLTMALAPGGEHMTLFTGLEGPLFPAVHFYTGGSAEATIVSMVASDDAKLEGVQLGAAGSADRAARLAAAFGDDADAEEVEVASSGSISLASAEWNISGAKGSWDMVGGSKLHVKARDTSGILLNHGISTGTLEWSVRIEDDSVRNEHGLLGVCVADMRSADYDSSSSAPLVVRAYNGALYQHGSAHVTRTEMKFHPDEVVSFKLECGDGSSKPKLVYTNPRGSWELTTSRSLKAGQELFPCALVYSNGCSVKLTKLEYTPFEVEAAPTGVAPGMQAAIDAGAEWDSSTTRKAMQVLSSTTVKGDKRSCVRFNKGIKSGRMVVKFVTRDQTVGNEGLVLGFSKRTIGNENYDLAACGAYLVRCYNGVVHHKGRKQARLSGEALKLHSDEEATFTLDCDARSITYTNPRGTHVLVAPGDLPVETYYPAVFTYGPGGVAEMVYFETDEIKPKLSADAGGAAAGDAAADGEEPEGPIAALPPVIVSPTETLLEHPVALPTVWQVDAKLAVDDDKVTVRQKQPAPKQPGALAVLEEPLPLSGASVAEFVVGPPPSEEGEVSFGVTVNGDAYMVRLKDTAVYVVKADGRKDDVAVLGAGMSAGSAAAAAPVVEPVRTGSALRVGDKVRVRAEVSSPRYGWGSVKHSSVGTIRDMSGSTDCHVDFPEQSGWNAVLEELETVPEAGGGGAAAAPTVVVVKRRVRLGVEVVPAGPSGLALRFAYKVGETSFGVVHDCVPVTPTSIVQFAVGFSSKEASHSPEVRAVNLVHGQPMASSSVRGGGVDVSTAPVERTSVGGLLWSKGYSAPLVGGGEALFPLQRLAMRMANNRQLVYELSFREEADADSEGTGVSDATFRMLSFKALPPDTWSHVTLTQDLLSARLFINGELVAARPLPESMWQPPTVSAVKQAPPRTLESKHPYENNTRETTHVEFPGALAIEITFDPRSKTEERYDYVRFLRGTGEDKQDYFGEEMYTGTKFPGMNDNPPLLIPASSFSLYWYTDGSGTEQGWWATATPKYPSATDSDKVVPSLHAPMKCTTGSAELDMDGLTFSVSRGFPTVTLDSLRVTSGKWYYEATLLEGASRCIQVGWIDDLYSGNSSGGAGVGDCAHSWAYDGDRVKKWHNGSTTWGASWSSNSVVGCLVDLDERTMSFSLDGKWAAPMGLAFTGIDFSGGMRPGVCGNSSTKVKYAFGGGLGDDLKYPLPAGASALGSVVADDVKAKAMKAKAMKDAAETLKASMSKRIQALRRGAAGGEEVSSTLSNLEDVVVNSAPLVFGAPLVLNSEPLAVRQLLADAASRAPGAPEVDMLPPPLAPLGGGANPGDMVAAGAFVSGVQIAPFASLPRVTAQTLAEESHPLCPLQKVPIAAGEGTRFLQLTGASVATALSLVTEVSKSAFGQNEVSDAAVVGALLQLVVGSSLVSAMEAVALLEDILPGTKPDAAISGLQRTVARGMDGAATPRPGSAASLSLGSAEDGSGGAVVADATPGDVGSCTVVVGALLKYAGAALHPASTPVDTSPATVRDGVKAPLQRPGSFTAAVGTRIVRLVQSLLTPAEDAVFGAAWKAGAATALQAALEAGMSQPATLGAALAVLGGSMDGVAPGSVVLSSDAGSSLGGVEAVVTAQVPLAAEGAVLAASGGAPKDAGQGVFAIVTASDGTVLPYTALSKLTPVPTPASVTLKALDAVGLSSSGGASGAMRALFDLVRVLLDTRSEAVVIPNSIPTVLPASGEALHKADMLSHEVTPDQLSSALLRVRILRVMVKLLQSDSDLLLKLAADAKSGLSSALSAIMSAAGSSLLQEPARKKEEAEGTLVYALSRMDAAALEQAVAFALVRAKDAAGQAATSSSVAGAATPISVQRGATAVQGSTTAGGLPAVVDAEWYQRTADVSIAPLSDQSGAPKASAAYKHPAFRVQDGAAEDTPVEGSAGSTHPLQGWVGARGSLFTLAALGSLEGRLAQDASMAAMAVSSSATPEEQAARRSRLVGFLLSAFERLVVARIDSMGAVAPGVLAVPTGTAAPLANQLHNMVAHGAGSQFGVDAVARAVVTLLNAGGAGISASSAGAGAAAGEEEWNVQQLPSLAAVAAACWLLRSLSNTGRQLAAGATRSELLGALLSPRTFKTLRGLFMSSIAESPMVGRVAPPSSASVPAAMKQYFRSLKSVMRNTIGAMVGLLGHEARSATALSATATPDFLKGKNLLTLISETQFMLTACGGALAEAEAGASVDKQFDPADQAMAETAISLLDSLKAVAPFASIAAFATRVAALRRKHKTGGTPSDPPAQGGSSLPPLAPPSAAGKSKKPLFFDAEALPPQVDVVEDGTAVVCRGMLPTADESLSHVGQLSSSVHPAVWTVGFLAMVDEPMYLRDSLADPVAAVRLHVLKAAEEGSVAVGLVRRDSAGHAMPAIVWKGSTVHIFDVHGAASLTPAASVDVGRQVCEGDLVGITLDTPRRRLILSCNGTPLPPILSGEAGEEAPLASDEGLLYGNAGAPLEVTEVYPAVWLGAVTDSVFVRATVTALPAMPGPAPLMLQRSISGATAGSGSAAEDGATSKLLGAGDGLSTFLTGAGTADRGSAAALLSKAPWFDHLARVAGIARELASGMPPHSLLRGLFAAHFASTHTKVVETCHPATDGPGLWKSKVVVPGASALRVVMDSATSLQPGEVLTVAAPAALEGGEGDIVVIGDASSTTAGTIPAAYMYEGDITSLAGGDHVFKSSAAATTKVDAPSAPVDPHPPLKPGDRVVRDPEHWDWGQQDGGAGCEGTVDGPGDSENWIRVKWDHDGSSNVYPYPDTSGNYHLRLVGATGGGASAPAPAIPAEESLEAAEDGLRVRGNAASISILFKHASEAEGKQLVSGGVEAKVVSPDESLPTAPGGVAVQSSSPVHVVLKWPRFRPDAAPAASLNSPRTVFTITAAKSGQEPRVVGHTTAGTASIGNLEPGTEYVLSVGASWAGSGQQDAEAPRPEASFPVTAATERVVFAHSHLGEGASAGAVKFANEHTTLYTEGAGGSAGVGIAGAALTSGTCEWMYMVLELPSSRKVGLGAYAMPTSEKPSSHLTSSGMYLLDAKTGKGFANGSEVPGQHSGGISDGDVVKVKYDADAGTVSFEVNTTPIGVTLRDIPPGTPLAPAVCVGSGPGVQVALLDFSHTLQPTMEAPGIHATEAGPGSSGVVLYAPAAALPVLGTAAVVGSAAISASSGPVPADWGARMAVCPELDSRALDLALSPTFMAELPRRLAEIKAAASGVATGAGSAGGAAAGDAARPAEDVRLAVPAAPTLSRRITQVAGVGSVEVTDAVAYLQDVYAHFIHDVTSGWGPAADEELVTLVDRVFEERSWTVAQVPTKAWDDVWSAALAAVPSSAESKEEALLVRYPHLSAFSPAERSTRLAARYKLITTFNSLLCSSLPWVDLTLVSAQGSIASLLPGAAHWVLAVVKEPLLRDGLQRTVSTSGSKFELVLSRPRAYRFAASGGVDTEGRFTLFSQAWRYMRAMPPARLRRRAKLWTAQFAGERSHDDGGPYRECFAEFSTALQSDQMDLFVRVPNHTERNNSGANRDCWVFNPEATSATALSMFNFLGKVMGMALRNEEYLSLRLPPFLWCLLSGGSPGPQALKEVDLVSHKALTELANDPSLTEETFADIVGEQTFTTQLWSGRTVEVVAGGANKLLTWANREEYVAAVTRTQLQQVSRQVEAVRAGLATMVPIAPLALFSARQFQRLVCGLTGDIDIDLLAEMTDFSGWSRGDTVIQWYFDVLREASPDDVAAVLRFISGRPTIGRNKASFGRRFQIDRRSPKDSFPVAHTCYNTLDLPEYSSKELLRQRILFAAHNCVAIDGDDTGTGMANAALASGWS